MARLATSGFEFQVVGGAAVAESADFRVTSGGGSPTVETTTVRSGAAALKFASTANIAVARWDETVSNGTSTFLRAYLRFDGTPTGTARLLTIQTSAGTNIAQAQMASGQTALALRTGTGAGTQQGSSSASLSANTWYRVELKLNVNGASSVAELQLDGVLVATATLDLGTTAQNRFLVGQSVATATGVSFYFDDVAINNDSGANQNTYPGPGKIVLLKPVSDGLRDAWVNGASGTTNLWDAVDNTPPTGTAAASTGATEKIRNSAANTTDAYRATTATYSSAGITAADRINVVLAVANFGGAASGQQLDLSASSNPSNATATGSATTAAAAGTYPSNWLTVVGLTEYAPSLTLSSGAIVNVKRDISSGELFVDLMGVYVEYAPPVALDGTSAGTSSTSGTVGFLHALSGTSAGTSTSSGSLSVSHSLDGTSAGTSATTGSLDVAHSLSSTSAGTSTSSGTLSVAVSLAGTSAGTSTTSGSLTGSFTLSGTSAGASSTTGDLVAALSLAGASAGTSTTSGTLLRLILLDGTSAGASTTAGAVAVAIALTGTSTGSAASAGALVAIYRLAGTSAGTSTSTGTLELLGKPGPPPFSRARLGGASIGTARLGRAEIGRSRL